MDNDDEWIDAEIEALMVANLNPRDAEMKRKDLTNLREAYAPCDQLEAMADREEAA